MASSHVCNHSYRGEMIQLSFTAKCKLSLSLLLFLLTLPLARLDYADDDPADPLVANCGADKFMNGSASERNLKVVLRSLVDNVNKTGFYISSHGENGDKIYGLVQCRGDLNASTCQACVSNATQSVPEKCGGSISIHLSGCFLEYNSSNFYLEPNLSDAAYSVYCDDVKKNSTPGTGWNLGWKMATLLKTLIDNAVSSNASYSTLNDSGVYYLAQCWKDLSVNQCNQCLNGLYNSLGPGCPLGTREGYALGDNCVLRYVDHKFYGDGVPLLSQPQSTDPPRAINGSGSGLSRATHEGKSSPNLPLMLGLSIGGVVSVAMLLGLVVVWKRKVINTMYLDGDWVGITDDHKGTLGYAFTVFKEAINCFLVNSRGCIAATSVTCQAMWLRLVLTNLKQEQGVSSDNNSAISITQNPVFHSCTKHIDTGHHLIKELVADWHIN